MKLKTMKELQLETMRIRVLQEKQERQKQREIKLGLQALKRYA